MLLSLHVDDTLASGSDYELRKLHSDLEKQFGTIKASEDTFTHFGVQVWRDKETGNVHSSQKAYLAGLEPVPVPKGKEDTKCDPVQVTAFRSLVSAIAWGGVTNPAAQAGASLYQACLPEPTFADSRHLKLFPPAAKGLPCRSCFQVGSQLGRSSFDLHCGLQLGERGEVLARWILYPLVQ